MPIVSQILSICNERFIQCNLNLFNALNGDQTHYEKVKFSLHTVYD